jgi:hypothetical protein
MSDQNQDNSSTGFEDFEDFMKHFKITRQSVNIPDSISLMGYFYEEKRSAFLQIDIDHRLVIIPGTPKYDARLPVLVPAVVDVLEAAPTDGHNRLVVGIDVLNYTDTACPCALYLSEETPTSANQAFGLIWESILPYSLWSWRGLIELDATRSIWGFAGSANRLRAFFSVRYSGHYVRGN